MQITYKHTTRSERWSRPNSLCENLTNRSVSPSNRLVRCFQGNKHKSRIYATLQNTRNTQRKTVQTHGHTHHVHCIQTELLLQCSKVFFRWNVFFRISKSVGLLHFGQEKRFNLWCYSFHSVNCFIVMIMIMIMIIKPLFFNSNHKTLTICSVTRGSAQLCLPVLWYCRLVFLATYVAVSAPDVNTQKSLKSVTDLVKLS